MSQSLKAWAAVLHELGQPLVVEEVEVLPPGPGEVRVRMKAAGVCHSDLHVMKGDLPLPCPIIPGHEGAGVVESVGEGVTTVAAGDSVIPIWRASCGRCEFCLNGKPALCDMGTAMRFTGLMPDGQTRFRSAAGQPIRHYAGVSTFASVATMPEAAVVKVAAETELWKAALVGCGVITGVGAVTEAAGLKPGQTIAVWGCGGIGLNAIQGARLVGASRIIAVDVVPSKEAVARKLGATDFVDAMCEDPVARVRELAGGMGVDAAVEAIGNPRAMEQAFDAVKKGGVCVVAGITPATARAEINVNQLVYAEKTFKGTLYGSMRPRVDLIRLLDVAQRGGLDLDTLLTRTYRLEEINEAYADLEAGRLARGLIVWD
ncbi:MAG: Zn-dependent alcohol dehydrogenase [Verrucomicrobiales bacterium]|nr:Zn-dependent alcohol dehydrogenase [Verrucomicrobiales bacterium]